MKRIHAERLEIAASHIEQKVIMAGRQDRFDMGTWFEWADGCVPHEDWMYLQCPAHSQRRAGCERCEQAGGLGCGHAACAIGWACGNKELQAQGLVMDFSVNPVPTFGEQSVDVWGEPYTFMHRGWTAVEKFFGLPNCDAVFLFDANYYVDDEHLDGVTAQHVVERIRNFVNTAKLAGLEE